MAKKATLLLGFAIARILILKISYVLGRVEYPNSIGLLFRV